MVRGKSPTPQIHCIDLCLRELGCTAKYIVDAFRFIPVHLISLSDLMLSESPIVRDFMIAIWQTSQSPLSALRSMRSRALFFVHHKPKGASMFFPFLGAATVAIAFAQLGAMSVKIGMLTSSLYAVILIAIVLALYAISMQRSRA